jgi:hypothetical protein
VAPDEFDDFVGLFLAALLDEFLDAGFHDACHAAVGKTLARATDWWRETLARRH